MTADGPGGMASMRKALPDLKAALQSFVSSSSNFRVLRTVEPPAGRSASSKDPDSLTKTLFILDSSFNPPSVAHRAIATSALRRNGNFSEKQRYPKPWRLLLLFSTQNADKAASAAPFEHRLALMTLFAQDIQDELASASRGEGAGKIHDDDGGVGVYIDIGVTKKPYYSDKSIAIERDEDYVPEALHIHLCGFDSLTRIFAAKYYKDFNPPFSALNGFFEKHGLRVMMRPGDEFGDEATQRRFWEDIRDGKMEGDGAKREWADRIEMVPGEEGIGVSSTRVRRAAKKGDWEEVRKLCTRRVADWVREEKLYESDDRGSKWDVDMQQGSEL